MGSIRCSRTAVTMSMVALALAPAAAAMPAKDYGRNGATGDFVAQTTHKDYSKNGASGDYTPAGTSTSTSPVVIHATRNAQSFAWGAAALGGGSTLVLVMFFGLTARQVRRRRISAPSPARPAAA
jgi:hypothetical protein